MATQLFQRADAVFDKADMAWLMMCSSLVFLMVVSLCLVYSGLGRPLFAITLFKQPIITGAMIGFQWYLWGYTLTFTPGSTWFGSLSTSNALQMSPDSAFSPTNGSSTQALPELSFALFQGMFASFTAALVCAGTMQKMHSARYLLFISIWSTCIYIPIARWSWYNEGWSHQLGSMDFAGGTPVHIASGAAVAAMALFFFFEANGFHRAIWHLVGTTKERIGHSVPWVLGMWARRTLFGLDPWRPSAEPGDILPDRRPEVYDVNQAVLGTGLLWFGWFGFNGGSALGINNRAVSAVLSTHVAACSGGVTAVFLHWILKQRTKKKQGSGYNPHQFRKLTAIHFCDGAIAGLVSITPGSGYVPVSKSAVFGLVSSAVVIFMKPDSSLFLRDDELKVFLVHTVAGFIGMFMTGWLASQEVVESDGFSTWTERSIPERLGIQMADAASGFAYSFLGTIVILMIGKLLVFAVAVVRNRRDGPWDAWNQANIFKFSQDGNPAIEDRLRATDRHEWARNNAENGIELGAVNSSQNVPVENTLEPPRTSLSSSRAPQLESLHYSQLGSLNHSQLGSHHSQGGSLHHARSQDLPNGWVSTSSRYG
ncbi:putative ammonium transporter [Triangularia setosa]|uniref:Ammonium transporter n=1 Tax=Triangularia setosa TaxID=2587417 RepID=A0AAN6WC44_9PEZI|nr:putative ammonium transporter [Podospora setosa]